MGCSLMDFRPRKEIKDDPFFAIYEQRTLITIFKSMQIIDKSMTSLHLRELMRKQIKGRAEREMSKRLTEDWDIISEYLGFEYCKTGVAEKPYKLTEDDFLNLWKQADKVRSVQKNGSSERCCYPSTRASRDLGLLNSNQTENNKRNDVHTKQLGHGAI